ncbi:LysR family transcriptional regulator [Allorhodopirellula heiligendammensis]|uniref:Hca operon transcriptional activator n=1 Tax=Allorhodopirellula heiligendammensis TaxID=2714739 RepID=A0A5C6C918_9BACT|nr:LysR family transcriptional regulator [Allorhodopirellula heiligendammensis]TWU19921.1 Hca operon transcriptional activator [Allorhodopirellula heiligendammensis]
MELRHLRYFVAVASELSFSRAAEKSLVAQPALSTQIADLEREIGTPLFFRNKRVVRLTVAGAVFLKEAQAILDASEAAKLNALRASRGEFGELSIGFFAAPTMLFLPDLIRRFRLQYPDVTIQMFEMTPDKQLAALERGEINIAFTRPLPPGHPDLATQILFRERLLAVMAETHPLSSRRRVRLSDLAEERFVLLDRGVAISLYDHIIAACSSAGFSPVVAGGADLMATVLTMVAAEQGISIVPEGVQNLRNQQISFVSIGPAMEPIPLVMCSHKDHTNPTRDAFLQLVHERKTEIQQEFVRRPGVQKSARRNRT